MSPMEAVGRTRQYFMLNYIIVWRLCPAACAIKNMLHLSCILFRYPCFYGISGCVECLKKLESVVLERKLTTWNYFFLEFDMLPLSFRNEKIVQEH